MMVWEMVMNEVEEEMLGGGKEVYVGIGDWLEGVRRRAVRSLEGDDIMAWGVVSEGLSIFGDDKTAKKERIEEEESMGTGFGGCTVDGGVWGTMLS